MHAGDAQEDAQSDTASSPREDPPFDANFQQWLPQFIAQVQSRISELESSGHTPTPGSPSKQQAPELSSSQPAVTHAQPASFQGDDVRLGSGGAQLQEAAAKIVSLTRCVLYALTWDIAGVESRCFMPIWPSQLRTAVCRKAPALDLNPRCVMSSCLQIEQMRTELQLLWSHAPHPGIRTDQHCIYRLLRRGRWLCLKAMSHPAW